MHTHAYIHIIVSYLPKISLLYNNKWLYILTFLNKISKKSLVNQDMYLAILTWYNTPTEGGHYSPVQKLQSHKTHTQLLTASKLLLPEIPNGVDEEIQKRRQRAKQQCDKNLESLFSTCFLQFLLLLLPCHCSGCDMVSWLQH